MTFVGGGDRAIFGRDYCDRLGSPVLRRLGKGRPAQPLIEDPRIDGDCRTGDR